MLISSISLINFSLILINKSDCDMVFPNIKIGL